MFNSRTCGDYLVLNAARYITAMNNSVEALFNRCRLFRFANEGDSLNLLNLVLKQADKRFILGPSVAVDQLTSLA
jgi:hypothetical protein